MFNKRDWITMGIIILAQVGLVVCYWIVISQRDYPRLPAEYAYVSSGQEKSLPVEPEPENAKGTADKPAQNEDREVIQTNYEIDLPEPQPLPPAEMPLHDEQEDDLLKLLSAQQEAKIDELPPAEAPPIPMPSPEPLAPLTPEKKQEDSIPEVPPIAPDEPPLPQTPAPPEPEVIPPLEEKTPITPLPSTPLPKPEPEPEPAPLGPCPWKLRLEIVEGRTHLTARTDDGVEFLIRCDNLQMKRPHGRIEAAGKVQIIGKDFEGQCEQLTISWHEDQIQLRGDAHISSRRNGELMELKAEQLRLRLNAEKR